MPNPALKLEAPVHVSIFGRHQRCAGYFKR